MAASIPLVFSPLIPTIPSPDQSTFAGGHLSPELLKVFVQDVYGTKGAGTPELADKRPNPPVQASTREPTQPRGNPTVEPDPKHLAMASRIASYYQQQCLAVVGYQQRRCQAWANTHRQKCQETIHAAVLVVAWCIRDRIQRRQKRQRRRFRRGLSERHCRPTIAKRQSVTRWITGVPKDALSPTDPAPEKFADQEEADFSMDNRESTPDEDSQLFNVADSLIKNHPAKVNIPLMGVLSLGESDSDSENEREDNPCDNYDEGSERYEDGGKDSVMDENKTCDEDDLEDGESVVSSGDLQMVTGTAHH